MSSLWDLFYNKVHIFLWKDINIVMIGDTGRGGGDREVLMDLLRSWQLSRKKREGGFKGLAQNSCQSTDHNGNSYFRLDTLVSE
jgi:hypothetical protein